MKQYIFTPAALVWFGILSSAWGQGTTFTYQGRLSDGGAPANGICDLRFTIYDAVTRGSLWGGPITNSAVLVSNGLFTVTLDFGSGPFAPGAPNWLEIGVLLNGSTNGFTALNPRQPLTATPYAIVAGSVSGGINGNTISNGTITASKIATNQVVTSLNQLRDDVTLKAGLNIAIDVNTNNGTNAIVISAGSGSGGGGNAWLLTGNAKTVPGVNFVGTTDNQALQLHVNGLRALRLEPAVPGPNVIGGSRANLVARSGAATIGGGISNAVLSFCDGGLIGGGMFNLINTLTAYATVGGGAWNTNTAGDGSTIGGGTNNYTLSADVATIGGGGGNSINQAPASTIGGGAFNAVGINDMNSTISGGFSNQVLSFAPISTIGGGRNNLASALR